MTIWENIYQNYKNGGEEYATLKKAEFQNF